MFTDSFEQWLKLNKQFTSPFTELTKSSTEMWQRFVGENLEITGENISRLSEQFRRLSTIKRPEDFINLQKECINENMTAALENMQKLVNASIENIDQLTKCCHTLHEPFMNAMQKTAEKSKKYAEKAEDIK